MLGRLLTGSHGSRSGSLLRGWLLVEYSKGIGSGAAAAAAGVEQVPRRWDIQFQGCSYCIPAPGEAELPGREHSAAEEAADSTAAEATGVAGTDSAEGAADSTAAAAAAAEAELVRMEPVPEREAAAAARTD